MSDASVIKLIAITIFVIIIVLILCWESDKDDNTDEDDTDDTDDEWTEDDALDYHTEIFAKGMREQKKVLTAVYYAKAGIKKNLSIDETIDLYRAHPPDSKINPDGFDHTELIKTTYKEIAIVAHKEALEDEELKPFLKSLSEVESELESEIENSKK